jgi:hypothetical protein
VDRHNINADPDPIFHFEADPDPDPTLSFAHGGKLDHFLLTYSQQCQFTSLHLVRHLVIGVIIFNIMDSIYFEIFWKRIVLYILLKWIQVRIRISIILIRIRQNDVGPTRSGSNNTAKEEVHHAKGHHFKDAVLKGWFLCAG